MKFKKVQCFVSLHICIYLEHWKEILFIALDGSKSYEMIHIAKHEIIQAINSDVESL